MVPLCFMTELTIDTAQPSTAFCHCISSVAKTPTGDWLGERAVQTVKAILVADLRERPRGKIDETDLKGQGETKSPS